MLRTNPNPGKTAYTSLSGRPVRPKMGTALRLLCALLSVLLLSGCSAAGRLAQPSEREIFAMDTVMYLTAYGKGAENALDAAEAELFRLDALLSAESEASAVGALNETGSAVLPEDAGKLLAGALDIYKKTGGAFDITVRPLMEAYGFTTDDYRVPSDAEIKALLANVGADRISYEESTGRVTLPDGVRIDLGGIAKGYAGDRIKEILAENGIESALLNLGGNVAALGAKPDGSYFKIAVRDPENAGEMAGVVSVKDKSVVTSGGYERYFEKDGKTWHHILDPKTGRPAKSGLLSVTVVAKDGMLADGLSTALFVMGKDDALAFWRGADEDFDLILIEENGDITVTEGLSGSFSSEKPYTVAAFS